MGPWACNKCGTIYERKTEAGSCCHDSKAIEAIEAE